MDLHIDLETASELDLTKVGAYAYWEHPSTFVRCMAWHIAQTAEHGVWTTGQPMPDELVNALRYGRVHAWNAQFERLGFARLERDGLNILVPTYSQWRCSAAQARKSALPGKLEDCAKVLGTRHQKLDTRVMKRLSDSGHTATVDELAELYAYCETDVLTEMEISQSLPALSDDEQYIYELNERINDRGVLIDSALCQSMLVYLDGAISDLNKKLVRLTKGAVTKTTQVQRLASWLGEKSLAKEHHERLMEKHPEGTVKGDALRCRLDAARSSTAKYEVMLRQVSGDGRLRGMFMFAGAGQTGRFSSTGAQLHNLPRSVPENAEERIADAKVLPFNAYKLMYPEPVIHQASQLIRPALVAPPGKTFVIGDYSAVEARGLPWLAGHQPEVDAWAAGVDRYIEDAAAIGLGPEHRQAGKVVRLACIAEGEPVLTDAGLVPIEQVTRSHKVWDGESFVSHKGLVYRGEKEVITYDGLTATEDHIVWTEKGQQRLGDAAKSGARLTQSGAGRTPLRVGNSADGRATVHTPQLASAVCADRVQRVPGSAMDELEQPKARSDERLPAMLATTADTTEAGQAVNRSAPAMHEPQRSEMAELRGARHRVSVPFSDRGGIVGGGALGVGAEQNVGPYRQQRTLRTGELAMGDGARASVQHAPNSTAGMDIPGGGMAVCGTDRDAPASGRFDAGRDHRKGEFSGDGKAQKLARDRRTTRVYDLLNCGPQHRFTVSGKLVHNCGFSGKGGALLAMAKGYGMRLTKEDADRMAYAWHDANPWVEDFAKDLKKQAVLACQNVGVPFSNASNKITYGAEVRNGKLWLFCRLPSGRILSYFDVRTDYDSQHGTYELSAIKPRGGYRDRLWHGLLAENVTQAACNDLLRHAIVTLHAEGYAIVAHVHDETVEEVDEDSALEESTKIKALMEDRPEWAGDFPLVANVHISKRYTK